MNPPGLTTRGARSRRKADENPYLGPRAFRRENELFGRKRETRNLRALLVAERIVLMHAPSGAGKTSLIQASLIGRLEKDEFHVSGPLRVKAASPRGSDANRYLRSIVLDMTTLGAAGPQGVDWRAGFADWLTGFEARHEIQDHVLIFDQFEEIVTLDPSDRVAQHEFFRELGEALKPRHRWALFSMREDYMGGLDRYLGLLPTQLRVRYRLDFLGVEAAKEAARMPAKERGVDFTSEAADLLIADLASQRIAGPDGGFEVKQAYVEPVQLQVVCHTVWSRLAQGNGGFQRIGPEDVEGYDDFEVALGGYYADVVGRAARNSRMAESAVRRWFQEKLITPAGFKSQTFKPPTADGGDREALLAELEKRYLIRSDLLGDQRWYELSHDGLVDPIRADNRRWFRAEHGPWFELAWDWLAADKRRSDLLTGEALREATRWLGEHPKDAGELVREFIEESEDRASRQKLERARELALAKVSAAVVALSVLAVLEAIVIVALLLA